MTIVVTSFTPDRVEAVKAFNCRLYDSGERIFRLPEHPNSSWLPPDSRTGLFEEFYIANDGDQVRGGYILKHQPFWLNGSVASVGCPYAPISEAATNSKFGVIGFQLLLHALRHQKFLYGLGGGGFENRYPKLLGAMGWKQFAVPFFFFVTRPAALLDNLTYASRYVGGKLVAQILAHSGLGWLTLRAINAWRASAPPNARELSPEPVIEFGEEADAIWHAARTICSLVAVRDRRLLNQLYRSPRDRFIRLRVSRSGKVVGWAVALDTRMSANKFFGNARVGSVIDCLALPGSEQDVVHAVTRILDARGVDIIVTNQTHETWCAAFRRVGWMRGPSNFIFSSSPKLTERLAPFEARQPRLHFTRGDGEGPSHL